MLIGYARVSKTDRSQATDLQIDALLAEGVKEKFIYQDHASGERDDRLGLQTVRGFQFYITIWHDSKMKA